MIIEEFQKQPVLGIIRGVSDKKVRNLINTCIQAGLKSVEITLNTEDAYILISLVNKEFKGGITIGAGTVLSRAQAENAYKSGATFIVSPNFNSKVASFCKEKKCPYFPGALTPGEIYEAHLSGASMIKVFPASVFGPKYFKDVLGPFSDIRLMAVGGVSADNVSEYFKCGASAVAFGASIFRKDLIESDNWKEIKELIKHFLSKTQLSDI